MVTGPKVHTSTTPIPGSTRARASRVGLSLAVRFADPLSGGDSVLLAAHVAPDAATQRLAGRRCDRRAAAVAEVESPTPVGWPCGEGMHCCPGSPPSPSGPGPAPEQAAKSAAVTSSAPRYASRLI